MMLMNLELSAFFKKLNIEYKYHQNPSKHMEKSQPNR